MDRGEGVGKGEGGGKGYDHLKRDTRYKSPSFKSAKTSNSSLFFYPHFFQVRSCSDTRAVQSTYLT